MSIGELKKLPATIDELIGSSREGRFELVDGKLERVHMSPFTSRVASRLISHLVPYCDQKQAGVIYESEVYYRCFSNLKTSRKPDVSFIAQRHLPPDADEVGYFTLVPDLVVEVVSPKDRALKVERKIREYRKASVPLLWVIYPQVRFAKVFHKGSLEEIEEDGLLDGRDVLPGFRIRLGDLLMPLPRPAS
jgi:Uma2 family endonuclease